MMLFILSYYNTQWLILSQVVQQNPVERMIWYCIGIKADEMRARHGDSRNGWRDNDVKGWSAWVLFFPSVQLKKRLN